MRWFYGLFCVCLLFSSTGCSQYIGASLPGECVLIDPGHGGFDGGAVAEDGTLEKHLNLAIGSCIRDMLHICGVPVEMTRYTDSGVEENSSASIREKKVSDMRRRLSMYDGASLVISIHQNKFAQSKYSGAQVFYSGNHPDSILLAQAIRQSVVERLQPLNERELKKATDGIYLLHHTRTPSVLIECGFLSNPNEREQLKSPAYQQQIAFAVVAGYWNFQSPK